MDAIVCGAGTAGLAAAATLKGAGLETEVLERGDGVATSWRGRYASLRLNTLGWMASQPGLRASRRRYGEFPTRDRWIAYLEDYRDHHDLRVSTGVEVRRIDREEPGWRVETSAGERRAPVVVVATGFDHDPWLPEWPGREGFAGELLHAARYVSAEPFRGRDALVVGTNISGTEIAAELARGGSGRVWISARTPPNIFTRKWLGSPLSLTAVALDHMPLRLADAVARTTQRAIFGRLDAYGLPFPEVGAATNIAVNLRGAAVDDGFVAEVKAGRIEVVPGVEGFDGDEVVLAGGRRLSPDVVIAATGYRRGLEPLVGHLGVLDGEGRPTVHGGDQHPDAPGLYFAGYTATLAGQLRQMRPQAKQIAKAVSPSGRRKRRPAVSPSGRRKRRPPGDVTGRA
jgi:putative flavoprotein involved in K+ transport